MAKFRKRYLIEAIQVNNNIKELQDFIGDNGDIFYDVDIDNTATNGAYIIKSEHGKFYPCSKDIFESEYEKVEE